MLVCTVVVCIVYVYVVGVCRSSVVNNNTNIYSSSTSEHCSDSSLIVSPLDIEYS
jgi:hypothetical protein